MEKGLSAPAFFEVCAPCSDAHGDCCWAKTRAKIANKRKIQKQRSLFHEVSVSSRVLDVRGLNRTFVLQCGENLYLDPWTLGLAT